MSFNSLIFWFNVVHNFVLSNKPGPGRELAELFLQKTELNLVQIKTDSYFFIEV